MGESISFLEMFPFCGGIKDICGGLDKAVIKDVTISREKQTMTVNAVFAETAVPAELHTLEGKIAAEYGLRSVTIRRQTQNSPKAGGKKAEKTKKQPQKGEIIFGKAIRGSSVAMETLTAETGSTVITGEIFSVSSHATAKRSGWVLSFEMTDYTGSIRVSKFFRAEDDTGKLKGLKTGMYITVAGHVAYNRYDEDIAMEPRSIVLGKKPEREDRAESKRVELHMHTRYSNMNALTDPAAAVNRAASWGHPAVAITDHGVVQAFPEAWKAGEKAGIKVIYGVEGYYINDLDDSLCVFGDSDGDLSDEFVAFDLETTGLFANRDRITELGAVIFRDGKPAERFNTFVNAGIPIPPEITELTGINDRDIFDAPDEDTVLRQFIEFIGNRPLVAHNAEFDTGFMTAAARRCGIDFSPDFFDTLTLSQAMLPDLKRFRLNIVAERLGLPEFRHHRASDDAVTCGKMMAIFINMLAEKGIYNRSGMESFVHDERIKNLKNWRPKHLIILAKNKRGLKNLYKLISISHLEYFSKKPIIPKSLLMRHRDGLILGSACRSGEVFDAVARYRSDEELARLCEMYDYLEIQPLCNNSFMLENGMVKDEEELRNFNRRVVELGEKFGKPVVAAGDVHFLDPEHEIYRSILRAGKKYLNADRPTPVYFKTTDEMLEEFGYLGEEKCREVVIDNSVAIAELCEEIKLLPDELFVPKIENSAEDLQDLVYGRMHELYGEDPPETVSGRVKTELHDILERHFDVIYMSAQKLVSKSLEAGYLVGSRGSVGSSVVAYMSGITEVNALPAHYRCPKCKYTDFESGKGYGCGADMPDAFCPVCGEKLAKDGFDIPFETFLGFGGEKVPDIDLNFSGEYQANAHNHTVELFGRDHVFRAGTIGTLAGKTAYGYVKNYLVERDILVTKAEENRLSLGCVGVKRTTGQHPGGLVIIPQDMEVTDFCPVQHPADDPESGVITTHFEYHSMESNLLKLDELGHDDPTMIKMLEDLTGVSAINIPLDDAKTLGLFLSPEPLGLPEDDPIIAKTGTIGIPEFGTAFTRQMLVDTKPTDFDTLVRLSGFSHGTDVWAGNIRELVLSGTADVKETVSCRDDIMLYLISKGMEPKRAFAFMEAVRKGVIHKGRRWPDEIVEEMRRLGVPEWYIESCRKIQYLFPKAHAVAYVMMAFRIAYFKVHYPIEYYSCHFYRRIDSFDAGVMTKGIEPVRKRINEIKREPKPTAKEQDMLITLESVYEFYLRGYEFAGMDIYSSDANKFLIDEGKLIPPFIAVSGLGETAANDLVKCRQDGRIFISSEELMSVCPKVSQTHIQQLRALGALGDMPETSQMSLF